MPSDISSHPVKVFLNYSRLPKYDQRTYLWETRSNIAICFFNGDTVVFTKEVTNGKDITVVMEEDQFNRPLSEDSFTWWSFH